MELSREQLARVWLQCAPMGAWNRLNQLKEQWGGALSVWERFTPEIYSFLGPEAFSMLADSRAVRCGPILRSLDALGAYPVFRGDSGYPPLLSGISDPPDVLFVLGTLPKESTHSTAIVGSRNATRYGYSQARRIGRDLAIQGVAVVSGLARGVDAAAHQGALDGNGITIAVLGCGFEHLYPPENKNLASQIIAQGGAIITELAPDTMPMPYHFPVRNRIISGLSEAVLLIEAQKKSGTHSTIRYALDQGREVFALPGNVDAPGSELPLQLLKEGAHLCTCALDILEEMEWREKEPQQASFLPDVADSADEDDPSLPILRALALEEKTLEELIAETHLSAGELGTRLTMLEISGKIERRAGRAYALVRS